MPEVDTITPLRARELTDRIKVAVEATWVLIKEAYTTRAWAALGYDTWDEYCAKEFGTTRLKLPREERQEVVGSLREAGLSIRAIASATNTSVGTVHQSDVQNRTPDHHSVTGEHAESRAPMGVDGKVYPSQRESFHTDEYWDAGEPAPAPRAPKPARAPRTDVVATITTLLAKTDDAAALANRITADHMATRKEEAAVWSRRLETALEPLQRLLNTLKENQ